MRNPAPLPSAILATALLASTLRPTPAWADPAPPLAAPVAPAVDDGGSARRSAGLRPQTPVADDTRALRFTAGVSLTGIGGVSAILAGILIGRAVVEQRAAAPHCNAAARCDLAGYALGSEAQDHARVAQIALPVGVALAGAGIGLILSAPPKKAGAAAWLSPAPGGFSVRGRW